VVEVVEPDRPTDAGSIPQARYPRAALDLAAAKTLKSGIESSPGGDTTRSTRRGR
jgi:hypothetical protein